LIDEQRADQVLTSAINNQNRVMGLTHGVIARILRAMKPLRKSACNICRIIIS